MKINFFYWCNYTSEIVLIPTNNLVLIQVKLYNSVVLNRGNDEYKDTKGD